LNTCSTLVKRVCVIRDDHMGDMILTTGLVRSLVKYGYQVHVLGRKAWQPVMSGQANTYYWPLEDLGCKAKGIPYILALIRWLRKIAPDVLYLPYSKHELLWASLFSGVSKRYVTSGRYLGRLTFHHCLKSRLFLVSRHYSDVMLDFARAIGLPEVELVKRPSVTYGETAKRKVNNLIGTALPGEGPLIIVHPFHGNRSCHPRIDCYIKVVCRLLKSRSCRLILTGSKEEGNYWHKCGGAADSLSFWNSCGLLSLEELFALIDAADLVVCGSTGVLHIASAVGTASVSMFCPHPTVGPEVWGSLSRPQKVVCPKPETCARRHQKSPLNCGMPFGPSVEEILQEIHTMVA